MRKFPLTFLLGLLLGALLASPAAANGTWRYVWNGTAWIQEWVAIQRFDEDWPTDGAATADAPWQFEGRGDFLVFGDDFDFDEGLVILAPRTESSPWIFDDQRKRWAWMQRGLGGRDSKGLKGALGHKNTWSNISN